MVASLRPDESEDVIVSACQKLIGFFHQRPEQKIVFVSQYGLLPLMELLEVPRTRVCQITSFLDCLISLTLFLPRQFDSFFFTTLRINFLKLQVTCSVLQVLNQITKDNTGFQENACLVGLVSTVRSGFYS